MNTAMMRFLGHAVIVVLLTVLTQVGGLAWIASGWVRRPNLGFVVLYAMMWAAVQGVAPLTGRVPLPCFGDPLRSQSVVYCALLRNFVTPDLRDVAQDAAAAVAAQYPGTVTLALDGGFPFGDGFPLLPHLSHDDGEKLDFALYYSTRDGGYVPGQTRSPLGYFAFQALHRADPCPPVWLTLRWRLAWLQPLWRDLALDKGRTSALIRVLLADQRVGKVFIEPPVAQGLYLSDEKLRFQGCRAARHDDHVHFQLQTK